MRSLRDSPERGHHVGTGDRRSYSWGCGASVRGPRGPRPADWLIYPTVCSSPGLRVALEPRPQ